MANQTSLLILGGASEALSLARELNRRKDFNGRFRVITSLAGRTLSPRRPPGRVRVGGFGGIAGLARFLRTHNIALVVDATHPYAARISRHGAAACRLCGVPRIHLLRPPWRQAEDDKWRIVPDMPAAADALPTGARAFLAIGRQEIDAFAGREDIDVIIRTVDPAPLLPFVPRRIFITGRGPFCVRDEQNLLVTYKVTHLVCRNSGGTGSSAKLEAARVLGLPVIMVARPPPPPGPRVASVDAALQRIRQFIV